MRRFRAGISKQSGTVLPDRRQDTLSDRFRQPESYQKKEGFKGRNLSGVRSGRYLAYKDSEGQLLVEDLETGNTHPVRSSGGERDACHRIYREDFIYGQARNADSVKDAAGNQVFPMYQNRILSPEEDYKVVKTYEKGGYYITDAV